MRKKVAIYCAMALIAKIKLNNIKKKHKRRWWVRPIYADRSKFGFYETTFPKLKNEPEMFFKATRMTVSNFDTQLTLTLENLQKYSARKPILPECRLLLTLLFLAHGGKRYMYALKFKMSVTTVCRIVTETCSVIWNTLSAIHLAVPNLNEWNRIALQYEQKWRMPNCLGAIDGKHISIVCPPNAGSQYYNYKGRHSIVLLAVCDANYCFTMVDIGAYGSQSDGGIFAESSFGKLLKEQKLEIPSPKELPSTSEKFPFYFVGDNAFPLSENLMRPFPGNNCNADETNFNKRLSHARVTIENSFGILAARWRMLRNDIHALPNHVDSIIKACVILHNYLMLQKCAMYCPQNNADRAGQDCVIPGQWRNDNDTNSSLSSTKAHNAAKSAINMRQKLCHYLKTNQ